MAWRAGPERTRLVRRVLPAVLLVAVSGGVAVSVALAGPGPAGDPAPDAGMIARLLDAPATVQWAVEDVVEPVVAPSSAARQAAPRITVSAPPPPPPPAPAASSPRSTAGGRSLGPGDVGTYCANPDRPYGASSAQGLLTAANRERARLGIGALTWSSSLASAAAGWSSTMASTGQMSHNPSAPGAENVAYVSSSGGYSRATAVGIMHANWMRSSGHCRNIMNPSYTQMGAGVASNGNGTSWYATENFR
ncbi:CAP domain-containing protein [Demequina sp.]|uniref:CAP domain-containing protein n=1 Tax=Demequina sp. TaxID=2050685 RepID=UPI0025E2A226|nr:CAP domain-containing protein [Demequina sp.]